MTRQKHRKRRNAARTQLQGSTVIGGDAPISAAVLPEPQAAKYVAMSRAFLRQSRRRNSGPVFLRIGRTIRYRVVDLNAWLESRRCGGNLTQAS